MLSLWKLPCKNGSGCHPACHLQFCDHAWRDIELELDFWESNSIFWQRMKINPDIAETYFSQWCEQRIVANKDRCLSQPERPVTCSQQGQWLAAIKVRCRHINSQHAASMYHYAEWTREAPRSEYLCPDYISGNQLQNTTLEVDQCKVRKCNAFAIKCQEEVKIELKLIIEIRSTSHQCA